MLKKSIRIRKVARAVATFVQLADEKEDPTPWEELEDDDRKFATDMATCLVELTDALVGRNS